MQSGVASLLGGVEKGLRLRDVDSNHDWLIQR